MFHLSNIFHLSKRIYSIPLSELRGKTLDISPYATPCKFRFVHCGQLLDDKVLAIHEVSEIPARASFSYAAISYVWKGLPAHTNDEYGTFAIKGAEDGDLISIDVLIHACTAAKRDYEVKHYHDSRGFNDGSSRYIWLDKLCMLQDKHDVKARKDKPWQIRNMHQIYSKCTICIVLPGGMRRLARVDEDTTWIERSWTFQEATAQVNTFILFHWTLGKLDMEAKDLKFRYEEVIPGQSAICTLITALQCNSLGRHRGFPIDRKRRERQISVNLLGRTNDPHVFALLAVTESLRGVTEALPDVKEDDVLNAYRQGVWRCSLMRTSSRPVDTVFSIMGMFGVTLDPDAFDENDRRGATIALAKALLQTGQRASWLAPFISLPPAKGLSAFPKFPDMHVARQATLGKHPVAELLNAKEGWLNGVPLAQMDDDGYLTFSAPAAPLVREITAPGFVAVDGSRWRTHTAHERHYHLLARTYLVQIGEMKPYPSVAFPQDLDKNRWRALLVEENGDGTVYRRSYFILSHEQSRLVNARATPHTFRLGGDESRWWSRLLCC
ncbi:uncharacterized protein EDB91DRAFT_1350106 [Suillus paluster]|uniref:uncharacterized protein n=1 Tax=Suillus paluster TaxID=48578 RepID=UPI001B877349|nr:uncharacterized protein EDB91DRAFT_1350106 [Suillus paluster]KAG1728360.1 hypothetical protein EDB91DRAFT_1350106 [Suillus paluster]